MSGADECGWESLSPNWVFDPEVLDEEFMKSFEEATRIPGVAIPVSKLPVRIWMVG